VCSIRTRGVFTERPVRIRAARSDHPRAARRSVPYSPGVELLTRNRLSLGGAAIDKNGTASVALSPEGVGVCHGLTPPAIPSDCRAPPNLLYYSGVRHDSSDRENNQMKDTASPCSIDAFLEALPEDGSQRAAPHHRAARAALCFITRWPGGPGGLEDPPFPRAICPVRHLAGGRLDVRIVPLALVLSVALGGRRTGSSPARSV